MRGSDGGWYVFDKGLNFIGRWNGRWRWTWTTKGISKESKIEN